MVNYCACYGLVFCLAVYSMAAYTGGQFNILPVIAELTQAKSTYNAQAKRRFKQWHTLIKAGQGESDWQRLHLANAFANKYIEYASDLNHWHKNDYWATPIESLSTGKGDCEDYAIFKYISLRAMGVAEHKLRIMYVRAKTVNQPHMVLVYYKKPSQIPLVLDNIVTKIAPASKRADLTPIYSFNVQGVWLAKAQGLGKKITQSKGVGQWQQLLNRIEQGK